MISLSDDTQGDVIEAFNSTSGDLDDLFNIDNLYFKEWSFKCIVQNYI